MTAELDKSKWFSFLASVAVLGFIFAWFPFSKFLISDQAEPILKVAWQYSGGDDWEHCRIVPVLALFLVYLNWGAISQIPWEGRRSGIFGFLLSGFFFWLGYITDIHYLAYISFQGMIVSLVLWFAGVRMLKALLFPLVFLTFMWPWLFLDNVVAFPLRLLMSKLAHVVLNLIGVANLQIGSAIVSAPDYSLGIPQGARFQLDVANPCSGIRSLFALTMITALWGHLTLQKTWQKITLFACSVPLAIFGNLIRILMLTFGTIFFGVKFAVGTEADPSTFHMGAGYFVYVVEFVGMYGISKLLEKDILGWWNQKRAAWKDVSSQKTASTEVRDSDQY